MAKGKHPKNKNNRLKNTKGRFKKKQKKNTTFRDIKHSYQYKVHKAQSESNDEKKLPQKVEEEYYEEPAPSNPLTRLLSTFKKDKNEVGNNIAIDSDEDEESSDEDMGVQSDEDELDLVSEDGNTSAQQDDEDHQNKKDQGIEQEKEIAVEEEEGDLNEEIMDHIEKRDEEEINNFSDPFHIHLGYELPDSMLDCISMQLPKTKSTSLYWFNLHNLKVEIPTPEVKFQAENVNEITIEGKKEFTKQYEPPPLITKVDWNKLCLKSQIQGNVLKSNKNQLGDNENVEPLTELQKELFSIMNNYQDLFYPERNLKNSEEIRFAYCLHVVNHILKTRLKVVHHNERLYRKSKEEVPDEYRDQGLVRPKVIILAPFKESCLRIVNMISSILLADNKSNIINKSRFMDEFSGSALALPKKNPKPEDYELLFHGNVDDTFRIGLSFTKKSLKLYSDFYSSDVIIASPLGLRMVIGAEGDHDRDFDFLASTELLILDQAEVFFMQNWDHLLLVFDHLHIQPKENHGVDFSRVRPWALNGLTKYYRQTLIFSSIILPELNSLFNRRCVNYAGKVRVCNPEEDGSICRVVVQLSQVFHKFEASSVSAALDARFSLFIEKILPQYKEPGMSGVLIYVPSYFDYVRLRNHLRKEDCNFVQICEYSKDAKVARARDMFFHDEARFLLYSERFHFFRRITLKGIRHIVFYQPPTFPHFYSEMCNLMQEGNQNRFLSTETSPTVTVLYCKYDVHQLSAIVKTCRAARMISSDKNVHMFTTGQ